MPLPADGGLPTQHPGDSPLKLSSANIHTAVGTGQPEDLGQNWGSVFVSAQAKGAAVGGTCRAMPAQAQRGSSLCWSQQFLACPRGKWLWASVPSSRGAGEGLGDKGQWLWPPRSLGFCFLFARREGGRFLQTTAQEFGIFKRMCRSKTKETEDPFQLKYQGLYH